VSQTKKTPRPFIININKPAGITSYDIIRKWKPVLKSCGKVGHFGTLDPFADGVLMLGVAGAQRLNDYIHEYLPKTYLAKGVLGVETDTGDPDGEVTQKDEAPYLSEVISKFEIPFIQEKLEAKFLGEYWQAPHKFSAAKFQGKPLHQWAREGVEIKKVDVRREVHSLEVVKYDFPNLWIRYQVSSGTYIRTLFRDCAIELGTIGMLEGLTREKVGGSNLSNAMESEPSGDFLRLEIDEVLSFNSLYLNDEKSKLFLNGVQLRKDQLEGEGEKIFSKPFWVRQKSERIIGLAEMKDDKLISRINFPI
tara:strand:- start:12732 stop:13652 length:921 start_codon:yes stop_codon:yes gene_type:complete